MNDGAAPDGSVCTVVNVTVDSAQVNDDAIHIVQSLMHTLEPFSRGHTVSGNWGGG